MTSERGETLDETRECYLSHAALELGRTARRRCISIGGVTNITSYHLAGERETRGEERGREYDGGDEKHTGRPRPGRRTKVEPVGRPRVRLRGRVRGEAKRHWRI